MPDIATELGYYKGQPVIMVKPKHERRSNNRFLVSMGQLHEWSEDHNATFEEHLFRVGNAIHELFDLGEPNSRKLADIAFAIQSRIDDLIKMPPLTPKVKKVADVEVTAAGEKFTHEIKDKVDGGYKQYTSG
jgi:hypothetical protein